MTILHLLSQLEVTGAETYVESLVAELGQRGHRFLVASDTLTRPVQAAYHAVRLHRRGWPDRFRNIRTVVDIVRREKVDLLHAHSRAGSWVGTFVTKTTGAPLVTTVHGIQHRHLSRRLFPAFGQRAIAVCTNIREQLVRELGVSPKRVVVIPNGIDLTKYPPDISGGGTEPVLLYLGRFSGPKFLVLKRFLSEVLGDLLGSSPEIKVKVVGRMADGEDLKRVVQPLWERFGRCCVSILGYREDLSNLFLSARVVVGSGRVVLEAMAAGKATIALGETDYLGVLTSKNFKFACASNFGDCSPSERINFQGAAKDLAELLKDKKKCQELGTWSRGTAKEFDIRKVADAVEETYQKCLSSPS